MAGGRMSDTGRHHEPSSDDALLDLVQRQTLSYFWDFAHPASGLARERSNPARRDYLETVTTGGTGFGIMAMLVAASRGWIPRAQVLGRLLTFTFLSRADRFHGVFPHFMNGATGPAFPFSAMDDGGDLVETSVRMAGALRAPVLRRRRPGETELRRRSTRCGTRSSGAGTRSGRKALCWNWSPRHGCAGPRHHRLERIADHVRARRRLADLSDRSLPSIAMAGPAGPCSATAARTTAFRCRSARRGGPLFFAHYLVPGARPARARDRYADYWAQYRAHTLINLAHASQSARLQGLRRFAGG